MKKIAAALASVALMATPIVANAQNSSAPRVAEVVKKKNNVEGENGILIAVVAAAAVIGGIIILSDDDSPTSP